MTSLEELVSPCFLCSINCTFSGIPDSSSVSSVGMVIFIGDSSAREQ